MKRLCKPAAAWVAVLLVIGGVLTGNVIGQVKKGKSRPMTTHSLMEGVVGDHCGALKKGLEAGASDEKALKGLVINAELLNESSHILMADSRCPDAVWADACKSLDQGSQAVLKALEAKDLGKAKEAFGEMTKSCGACHRAHKK